MFSNKLKSLVNYLVMPGYYLIIDFFDLYLRGTENCTNQLELFHSYEWPFKYVIFDIIYLKRYIR